MRRMITTKQEQEIGKLKYISLPDDILTVSSPGTSIDFKLKNDEADIDDTLSFFANEESGVIHILTMNDTAIGFGSDGGDISTPILLINNDNGSVDIQGTLNAYYITSLEGQPLNIEPQDDLMISSPSEIELHVNYDSYVKTFLNLTSGVFTLYNAPRGSHTVSKISSSEYGDIEIESNTDGIKSWITADSYGNAAMRSYNGNTTRSSITTKQGEVEIKSWANNVYIKMVGLPTSDPQVANALWNDNGTLKISAGA